MAPSLVWERTEGTLVSGREKVAELYKLYGPAIYRRCLRLLCDNEAARDATQEGFGKLMRPATKLEGRDTAPPRIYPGAANYSLKARRHAGRRRHDPTTD